MLASKSLAKTATLSPLTGCSGSTRTTRSSTATPQVSVASYLSSTSSRLRLAASSTTTLRVSLAHLSFPSKSSSLRKTTKTTSRAVLEATATQLHPIASLSPASTPRRHPWSGLFGVPLRSVLRPFSPSTFPLPRRFRSARLPLRSCRSWTTTTTIGLLRPISIASHPRNSACRPPLPLPLPSLLPSLLPLPSPPFRFPSKPLPRWESSRALSSPLQAAVLHPAGFSIPSLYPSSMTPSASSLLSPSKLPSL